MNNLNSNNSIDELNSVLETSKNVVSEDYSFESIDKNILSNTKCLNDSLIKLESQTFDETKFNMDNNVQRNIMKIKFSPGNNSETKILNSIISLPVSNSSTKRKTTRRFGMRRPKSRKQREEMSKLREVSMRLGGAQYFKKKSTESVACEV